jgi:small subunit ribosomal protein S3
MDIDYASTFAMTVYGKIGLKIWICKGEVLGKRDLNPNFSAGSDNRGNRPAGAPMGDDRRERRGGDRDRGERRGGGERGERRGGNSGGGRGKK